MPSLSRILVPVEFSPRCRGAVQYAEALSCHFHCEIVLLHVVMPPLANFSSFEAMAYTSAGDLAREIAEQRTVGTGGLPLQCAGRCPGASRRAGGRPYPNHRRVRFRREVRPDRDAYPRLRTLPPLPARVGHRQGAPRRHLSGMDRSPHGARAGLQHASTSTTSSAPSTSDCTAARCCAGPPGSPASSAPT